MKYYTRDDTRTGRRTIISEDELLAHLSADGYTKILQMQNAIDSGVPMRTHYAVYSSHYEIEG